MFALQTKEKRAKKQSVNPTRKFADKEPRVRAPQFYGIPIQMKNPDNLDLGDFQNFNFNTDDFSDTAYKLWKSRYNSDLPQEKTDEIYFEAVKESKKRQLQTALSSTDSATHPETDQFKQLMHGHFSDQEINEIWDLLLSGKTEQCEQNKRARLKTDTPELKSIYDTPEDYLFTSDLDEIRNQNTFYEQLANKIEPLLAVQGEKLALWSGGYDLSDYACRRGYVTLEGSTFGRILDSLYLSNEWNLIGPLWNIISKKFVEKYITSGGTEVHVFLRTYDPASVLIRQEISEIYKLDQNMKVTVKWHCIAQQGNDYYEICEDGTLARTSDEDHSAYDEPNCLKRLIRFLSDPQNQQAHAGAWGTMTDGFRNVLNSELSQIYEHLVVSEFRAQVQEQARQIWLGKQSPGQTPEMAKADYFEAERIVIENMRIAWCKNKAYEIWKEKGSPSGQNEQQEKSDYNKAEREFERLVNERIEQINQKRRDTYQERVLQKARLLWARKKKPQQDQTQQDNDYYEAERIVHEEDAVYDANTPHYAKLEILMYL